jgi:hypothetical protein
MVRRRLLLARWRLHWSAVRLRAPGLLSTAAGLLRAAGVLPTSGLLPAWIVAATCQAAGSGAVDPRVFLPSRHREKNIGVDGVRPALSYRTRAVTVCNIRDILLPRLRPMVRTISEE